MNSSLTVRIKCNSENREYLLTRQRKYYLREKEEMNNHDIGIIVGIIGGLLILVGFIIGLTTSSLLLIAIFSIGIGFFMIMMSSTISTRSGIIR